MPEVKGLSVDLLGQTPLLLAYLDQLNTILNGLPGGPGRDSLREQAGSLRTALAELSREFCANIDQVSARKIEFDGLRVWSTAE